MWISVGLAPAVADGSGAGVALSPVSAALSVGAGVAPGADGAAETSVTVTPSSDIPLGLSCGFEIDETALPMRPEVRGFCEILGLDPLYLANEGVLVAVVPAAEAEAALAAMRTCPEGTGARIIGRAVDGPPQVRLRTVLGGMRIVDMLVGEQLPRIC